MQTPPSLDDWPEITWEVGENVRRVNLDTVTPEDVKDWQPGETVLLSGKMLTGRDAAHKKMVDMIEKGEELPVDLKGRFIYYVGPVDPVREEVVGPAGPTTATRMDKFTHTMLEKTGLTGMIGKAERGQVAIDAIKRIWCGLPDGRGRFRLPGVQGHQDTRKWWPSRRTGYGSHLRVRGGGHAGHRRR